MDLYITKNFTLNEMTTTKQQLINFPDNKEKFYNLLMLTYNILQPLRDWYGKEIIINSAYRSDAVNKAIGGVRNSQHVKGQAADITIKEKKDLDIIFLYIKNHLNFDQLIKYSDFIHVSFTDKINRKQVLIKNL